jgi:hypothetical protein
MKERPIIFSGPMVRAILDGRKTQTRRIIKNPERLQGLMLAGEEPAWCPYGGPGDLLYVRETFCDACLNYTGKEGTEICHKADGKKCRLCAGENWPSWKPSIHMPKKYARIWLRVESVSADKLQEITEVDAKKEGMLPSMTSGWSYSCRAAFQELWDKINKDRAPWDSNPLVWIVEFSVISTTGKPEATQ